MIEDPRQILLELPIVPPKCWADDPEQARRNYYAAWLAYTHQPKETTNG